MSLFNCLIKHLVSNIRKKLFLIINIHLFIKEGEGRRNKMNAYPRIQAYLTTTILGGHKHV